MSINKIVVFAGYAPSLINFRGPLLGALVKPGNKVWALAPSVAERANNLNLINQLSALGVVFHPVHLARGGVNPFSDCWGLLSIFLYLQKIRPDYVIAYTVKPVIYVGIAVRLYRCFHRRRPLVYMAMITGLGYAFTDGQSSTRRRTLRTILKYLYRLAIAKAHVLVFQNPDDQAEFYSMGIVPLSAKTIRVWGSGVDLRSFAPHPLSESPVFLMLSRLLSDKGVREYVRAARKVKERYPLVEFRLAGAIDSNPASISRYELDAWISEGLIDYLGELHCVKSALSSCRFFVLPSYREGTPRSVLEAMAMRRPILTTDVPGCRETVVDGFNGYLVPPRDFEALAEAMFRLVEQPESVTQRMAEASLGLARDRFDVDKVNAQLLLALGL